MRRVQSVIAFFVVFAICAVTFFRIPSSYPPLSRPKSQSQPLNSGASPSNGDTKQVKPVPAGVHPMEKLITEAERDFEEIKARQSKSLAGAVAEYRRRYGIPPPPNFDKWYEYAKSRNVVLIDEFDMIHEMMMPFWGLKPATVRARAKEALGYENNLLGVLIRNHKITYFAGGRDWRRDATVDMISKFIEHLPSMDLAFNIHDEPRVVVPHDDLARLLKKGKEVNMAAAAGASQLRNEFTKPKGLNDGNYFEESKTSRFNMFPRQATWTSSRISCPADSAARVLDDDERADDVGRYGLGELGFVYNVTAMQDVCLSPSLSSSYGFFDGANAYSIVHDLFPIFSQSKLSSYNDILYPSPWYWKEKVPYEPGKDPAWVDKKDRLYWRGSTTGSYSRFSGWRRSHRQRFVQKLNANDEATIYANKGGDETTPHWEVKKVARTDYRAIVDVHFSHVGQCDEGDCAAQREFFGVKDYTEQQDAWRFKYLLDMDGNAFSGRFISFLRSRSLVFKFAMFKEWHAEWARPWAHYVPLSLQGGEWLETVRYFGDGMLGRRDAEAIALRKKEWADKALRKEDMEVWFFRVLLEYGRVIDDDRENIGFSL